MALVTVEVDCGSITCDNCEFQVGVGYYENNYCELFQEEKCCNQRTARCIRASERLK